MSATAPLTTDEIEGDTARRLLEAGSEIFTDQGFRAAKIRDIAARANANIAAINYHFGDKEGLYAAVMRHNAALVDEDYASARALRSPEARLKEFVRVFLRRLLDNTVEARLGKLMARESIEPTPVFEEMLEQHILPRFEALNRDVREILGTQASDETVRRCSLSIIGQCLHYQNSRRVIAKLDPEFRYRSADVERLAEHIMLFSIGGLRQLRRSQSRSD